MAFVRAMVDYVKDNYCVDAGSVHMTGFSNGAMFLYYAASRLNDIVVRSVIRENVLGFWADFTY